ncbi:unnamed protein product [Paramecium sonneborni]|uniref:Uncharacterized protein n=1 Tax=Paramecium sonneborni TaxID=65129 RepID=A0A8S1L7W8_9CILI|nr:unnamed protein product [Paramecium sonneborni]CAD8130335.1 unnamed protein product [Paramecium sonneborni]
MQCILKQLQENTWNQWLDCKFLRSNIKLIRRIRMQMIIIRVNLLSQIKIIKMQIQQEVYQTLLQISSQYYFCSYTEEEQKYQLIKLMKIVYRIRLFYNC